MKNFIQKFLPKTGGKAKVSAVNKSQASEFYMTWKRAPTLNNNDSAQLFYLASQALPVYSLSGPLKLNARSVKIAQPAPAISQRRFPNSSVEFGGPVGQVYSQPLYNNETGGYTREMQTNYTNPFNSAQFGNPVTDAGLT